MEFFTLGLYITRATSGRRQLNFKMWLGIGLGEEAWWMHYKWMEERRGLSRSEELTQGEASRPWGLG